MACYKATEKPAGWVNNVEVKCSKCAARVYVVKTKAGAMGGWECPRCGARHR
jgi:DNA-directed RNA polymerase subunit RPC12/RpoP